MDKKGGKYWIMVVLILGIIVAIVLIFQTNLFAQIAEEDLTWETCKWSMIYVHASTKAPILKAPSLACPMYRYFFIKEKTDNEISETIAEDVVNAIRALGGGGLDFAKGFVFESAKNCVVFGVYNFEKERDKKDPINFASWLVKNDVSFDKQYADYFNELNRKTDKKELNLYVTIDPKIDFDDVYYLYAVKATGAEGSFFASLAKVIGLRKTREFYQKWWFPDRAAETLTEEEIYQRLRITRLEFATDTFLNLACDNIYFPKTKKFETRKQWIKKISEEYPVLR